MKILLISLLTPLLTQAAVNMKDASFQSTQVDAGILERSYSSRSLYYGYFGFGWCSILEMRLSLDGDEPQLYECDRQIYLKKFKILKSKDIYKYDRGDREFTFDRLGRLLRVESSSFGFTIKYSSGLVSTLEATNGEVWKIQFQESGLFVEFISKIPSQIALKTGEMWMYEYRNHNLVSVQKNKISMYSYKYDSLDNMTEIRRRQSSKFERLRYDLEKDTVIEYKKSDGCVETYRYEREEDFLGPKETAKANIQCGLKSKFVTHEFWYQRISSNADLKMILARVRSTFGNETSKIKLGGI